MSLLGISTGPSSAAVAAAKKKRGGTLTYAAYAEPPGQILQFLPAGIKDSQGNATRLAVFDTLVAVVNDKVKYRLASSLETTDDGTTWLLTLRDGVEFSDGSPYNAEAVKYTWDFIADPANAKLATTGVATMSAFEKWEVVDDLTLRITLKAPNRLFPYFLTQCSCVFVGSKEAMEATTPELFAVKPIGAGAFMVDEYVRGSHVTLVRNPNYYKKKKPFLKKVIVRYITDDQQRYNTVVSGGADVGTTRDYNTAKRAKDAGLATKDLFLAGGIAIVFNSGIPPFDDIRARKALALAIDPEALNDAIFSGQGVIATSHFPPDSQYYDKSGEQDKADATKAQALFDELAAEGKPVEFAFMTVDQAPYAQMTAWIGARLASFKNVTMTIDTQTSSSFLGPYLSRTYQVFSGAFTSDPTSIFRTYHSTGTSNFFNYSDPAFDAAITQALSAADPATSQQGFFDAAKILKDDVGRWELLRAANTKYYDKSVVGKVPLYYDGMIDFTRVWKKKKS